MSDSTFRFENPTSYPSAGQMLFYPGDYLEAQILLAYGGVRLASTVGQLAGNHFLTLTGGSDQLRALGRLTLWKGIQDIGFELA